MRTRIVVLYAHADQRGYAYDLEVEAVDADGFAYANGEPNGPFKDAAKFAYDTASGFVPPPRDASGIACKFESIAGAPDVGFLAGGSLYGAVAMALIQLWARMLPEGNMCQMRFQYRAQLEAMRVVDLSKVAASAERLDASGDFKDVEGIDAKLKCLAILGPRVPSYCVLALGQKMEDKTTTPEQFLKCENNRTAVIHAADPLDGLCQIHAWQESLKIERYKRECRALAVDIA